MLIKSANKPPKLKDDLQYIYLGIFFSLTSSCLSSAKRYCIIYSTRDIYHPVSRGLGHFSLLKVLFVGKSLPRSPQFLQQSYFALMKSRL